MTMFDSLKALLMPAALNRGNMDGKSAAPSATASDFSALLTGADAVVASPVTPVTADPQVQAIGTQSASAMPATNDLPFPPNLVAPVPVPTSLAIVRSAADKPEIGQDGPALDQGQDAPTTLPDEETDRLDSDWSDPADARPDSALQIAAPIDGAIIGTLLMPPPTPPTPPSVMPVSSAADPNDIETTDASPLSAPLPVAQLSTPTASIPAEPKEAIVGAGAAPLAHAPLPASTFSAPDIASSRAPAAAPKDVITSGKDDGVPPLPLPSVAAVGTHDRPATDAPVGTIANTADAAAPPLPVAAPLRMPMPATDAPAINARPLSVGQAPAAATANPIASPSATAPGNVPPVIAPAAPSAVPAVAAVMSPPANSTPAALSVAPPPAISAAPATTPILPAQDALLQDARPLDTAHPQAEATQLLHLVRNQMQESRISAAADHGTVEASASSGGLSPSRGHAPAAASPLPSSVAADFTSPQSTPIAATITLSPPVPQMSAMPVDLGGTIGAQIVDMGVSGQWIDGLARDIAGLSANGGQGRFQINSDQLGTVQVSVRQGAQGADINLTVASEAAETALRQDSDRLRTDAALSAVRIADLKIERTPHIAESTRSDSAGSQQSNQNGNHANGQTPGQSLNQSAGQNSGQNGAQGRSQGRENFAASHKAADETSVLNHSDSRDPGDAVRRRARYA